MESSVPFLDVAKIEKNRRGENEMKVNERTIMATCWPRSVCLQLSTEIHPDDSLKSGPNYVHFLIFKISANTNIH